MTLKIPLSQVRALPFDFEPAVAAYIKARQDHRLTRDEPAPSAPHSLVEAAVRRVPGSVENKTPDDFAADYEIVDDTPPPPTLDQRKAALAASVQAAADTAHGAVTPPLKARLLGIELAEAVNVDPEKRTKIHQDRIDDGNARHKRHDAIAYHQAKLEAQIHDLTADTLDAWAPAPFPTA